MQLWVGGCLNAPLTWSISCEIVFSTLDNTLAILPPISIQVMQILRTGRPEVLRQNRFLATKMRVKVQMTNVGLRDNSSAPQMFQKTVNCGFGNQAHAEQLTCVYIHLRSRSH